MDKQAVPNTHESVQDHLTNELRAGIYRFVYSRVGSRSVAEDLTQEILIKAARAQASLREPSKLESWVFRIARNRIHDFFRASRRVNESYDEAIHGSSGSLEKPELVGKEEANLRRSLREYIRGVVNELPPHYRDGLIATEFEGLSQVAYAKRAGISVPAAKSRIQRGRREVRRIFEECCEVNADRYGNIIEAIPRSAAAKADPLCPCDSTKNT